MKRADYSLKNDVNKKYKSEYFYIALCTLSALWGIFYFMYAGSTTLDVKAHMYTAKYILRNDLEVTNPYPHTLAYPLYHIFVKLMVLSLGVSYEASASLVISVSIAVSAILIRLLIFQMLKVHESSYLIDFISIGSVIFMPAKSWFTDYTYYMIHTGANPLHNPTILIVRPFAVLSVMFFLRIIDDYNKAGVKIKNVIMFSIISFISVFAKPSFAFTFFPAMGLMCLYIMIHKKDLLFGIKMLCAVMPSAIALVSQLIYTRNNSDAMDVIVTLGGFTGYGVMDILKVTVGLIPTALILITRTRKNAYVLAWLAMAIGWFQMFFLSNGPTGDFSWGFMLAMQYVTVVSLTVALLDQESKVSNARKILGAIVFGYQVLMGMQYFIIVFINGKIWI